MGDSDGFARGVVDGQNAEILHESAATPNIEYLDAEADGEDGFVEVVGVLKEELVDGKLRFKPFSEKGFIDDLRTAAGVVASAGFTLMGEAVYLGRPMLALPVRAQFEQILNARYLEKLGFGKSAKKLETEVVQSFVNGLAACEEKLASYEQDGNTKILAALDGLLDRAEARVL